MNNVILKIPLLPYDIVSGAGNIGLRVGNSFCGMICKWSK